MESKHEVIELQRPIDNGHDGPDQGYKGTDQGYKTGTEDDAVDMYRMGKKQEFKRNFRSFSVLGLSSVIMGTWGAILASASFSLINGGLAGTVWMYLGVWVFTIPITLSLAEMASMAPTSGGQYHWTSEFSPPSCQKFLSYIVGWLSATGWQAAIAVTAYGAGNIILQMAQIGNPGYTPTPWQGTLMTMAVVIFSLLINTTGAKHLPLFESIILFLHVFGFFAILIPLWVLAPKAPAHQVFTEFSNFGGWSSVGAACIVGQLTATGSLGGSDSPAHLAEEVRRASTVVPRMMITTILLNGVLGFIMVITFCFCITDIVNMIVTSTSVFPYTDVFLAATGSPGGTIAMVSISAALGICGNLSVLAAGSRQTFAFARDHGLPWSGWLRKITVIGTPIPLNALITSLVLTVALSLLNLGSATAFNSIVGLLSGSGGVSYAISIGCVLWRRLFGKPLPRSPFSLGRMGVPINIIAFLYCILTTVISFFPLFALVTVEYMNYGVVMFGGVALISALYYLVHGRKVYVGPVVHLNYD